MLKDDSYNRGFKNGAIRWYYYLTQGLGFMNDFRNLFLGVLGLYIALKIDNPLLIVYMTIPSLIVLALVGYYVVHHVSKVKDWLGVKFGSHYTIKQFDYTKGSYELLKKIHDLHNTKTTKGNIQVQTKGSRHSS